MSLEREARRDSEDLGARAAALRERMRVGELSIERAKAAARCGEERARLLFPEEPRAPEVVEPGSGYPGVHLLGDDERRLLYCDCAERVLPVFEQGRAQNTTLRSAVAIISRVARGLAPSSELESARALTQSALDLLTAETPAVLQNIGFNPAQIVASAINALTGEDLECAIHAEIFFFTLCLFGGIAAFLRRDPDAPKVSEDGLSFERRWQLRRLACYLLGEAG